jgi:lipid-A-disaccharide synthase
MVGSRVGEVKKFLPVFIAAINKAVVEHGIDPFVVFPAVSEQVADLIASSKHKMKFEHKIIKPTSLKEKIEMLKAFDRAVVKSGTSTHELAAAHIPMITAYKVNPITYFIAKYVLKIPKRIKFISLVNLLLGEAVIPEYVQYECTPENLSDGLMKLYDPAFCTYQRRAYRTALRKLANPFNTHPSSRAAALILECVD